MKNSKSAPWHGESRKTALGSSFRKRNTERLRLVNNRDNLNRHGRLMLSEQRSRRFDEDDNEPFYRS